MLSTCILPLTREEKSNLPEDGLQVFGDADEGGERVTGDLEEVLEEGIVGEHENMDACLLFPVASPRKAYGILLGRHLGERGRHL